MSGYNQSRFYQPDSILVSKTVTFTGAAGAGAIGTVNLFTVTGDVELVNFYGKCSTDLIGATATLSVGVTGSPTAYVSNATAEDQDAGEGIGGTAGMVGSMVGSSADIVLANIILTVGTAAITAGVLVFYARYKPLSAGSSLVAA